jgi:glycosyltransferase involved in cell wall biosynthesis
MKRVLIIEPQMKQYRFRFFEELHEALCGHGIQLKVAYSAPPPWEAMRKDSCALPAEYSMEVKAYRLLRDRLFYQTLIGPLLHADLVIVDQANKNCLNHLLLALSLMGLTRVAFWGHGRCSQGNAFSEWYKRKTLNWVDWWFAYTTGTAEYLVANRVSPSKITAVQNSLDTQEIRDHVRSLASEDRATLRARFGIPEEAPVGIFCGVLHSNKSVPFLIESSRLIQARIPGFHLIIVGGGPEQDAIHSLTHAAPWIHTVGPRFGKDKAELLAIADVFLLPGAVGLAVLDAFAAGLPLITTRLRIHGPEIEYLEEEVNGLMADHDPMLFAEAAASLLRERDRLERLRGGALASCEKYSIKNMVTNFAQGIRTCLGMSRQETPARVRPAQVQSVKDE